MTIKNDVANFETDICVIFNVGHECQKMTCRCNRSGGAQVNECLAHFVSDGGTQTVEGSLNVYPLPKRLIVKIMTFIPFGEGNSLLGKTSDIGWKLHLKITPVWGWVMVISIIPQVLNVQL